MDIVITNSIHTTKRIFDLSIYPYQTQIAFISKEIRYFFESNHCNSMEFWNCPSQDKWLLHDKKTKNFNLTPLFPCKSSQEFSWKKQMQESSKQVENKVSSFKWQREKLPRASW